MPLDTPIELTTRIEGSTSPTLPAIATTATGYGRQRPRAGAPGSTKACVASEAQVRIAQVRAHSDRCRSSRTISGCISRRRSSRASTPASTTGRSGSRRASRFSTAAASAATKWSPRRVCDRRARSAKQARQFAALDTRVALNASRSRRQAIWDASRGTAEQAQRAYAIDEVRYREGISTQTDLTQSRLLLEQARANRAQAARNSPSPGCGSRCSGTSRCSRAARRVPRPRRAPARAIQQQQQQQQQHATATVPFHQRHSIRARRGVHQQGAFSHEPGNEIVDRAADSPSRLSSQLADRSAARALTPRRRRRRRPAMLVGPENVAVVKARADPLGSGDLRHARSPSSRRRFAPKSAARCCRRTPSRAARRDRGQVLARIDDAAMREPELSARAAVTTAQNTVDIDEA